MKFIIATLLAGGVFVTADMPNVSYDECQFVARNFETDDAATPINPEPDITAARLYLWCGQRSYGASGTLLNVPALKWVDIDREQAEILRPAIADILDDEDVFIGSNG